MTASQSTNPPLSTELQLQSINVAIQCLYVKEQSCKVPHSNQAFQIKGQPEISTEININSQPLEKRIFEVTLHLTLTSKLERRTLYQADVQQEVVIKTNSTDEKQLNHLLNIAAPTLLYPYIRKIIADLIYNAGFPPVFLPHMDFSKMYQQRVPAKGTETLEKIKPSVIQPSVTGEADVTVH